MGSFIMKKLIRSFGRKKKITTNDIIFFNRQLASMIKTEMPVVDSLAAIAKETQNKGFKATIEMVKSDIEMGSTISEAFARFPNVFPELYVSMIRAGEESGDLPTILEELSKYSESMAMLERNVKTALIYPGVMAGITCILFILLVNTVIPRFAGLYAEMGTNLPALTQMLLDIAASSNRYFSIIVAIIACVILLWRLSYRNDKIRAAVDRFKLSIPIYGKLLRHAVLWRFSRTLGALLNAGVPMLSSLSLVSATSGNKRISQAIDRVKQQVSKGEDFGQECEATGVFPTTMTYMIVMGTATGKLDEALMGLADFFDLQVNTTCRRISVVIEPVLSVIVGIVIGFILLSLYLPVFGLAGGIGG